MQVFDPEVSGHKNGQKASLFELPETRTHAINFSMNEGHCSRSQPQSARAENKGAGGGLAGVTHPELSNPGFPSRCQRPRNMYPKPCQYV
ncbi:hypothetical protein AAFF_G00173450 [Aldrovandia affinis]|uniref:Uncharacterized protein n=1 Tax=Aldrovandia affinis TaxID=143900 RepID=A0AAD7SYW9_9TELE|nr:hypothetical protein AAFF_G00173450 [Aldrovandia affinis]